MKRQLLLLLSLFIVVKSTHADGLSTVDILKQPIIEQFADATGTNSEQLKMMASQLAANKTWQEANIKLRAVYQAGMGDYTRVRQSLPAIIELLVASLNGLESDAISAYQGVILLSLFYGMQGEFVTEPLITFSDALMHQQVCFGFIVRAQALSKGQLGKKSHSGALRILQQGAQACESAHIGDSVALMYRRALSRERYLASRSKQ